MQVCATHWARYGVFSDAAPEFLPSGSSRLKGRREAGASTADYKTSWRRSDRTLCVQCGSSVEEDLCLLREGAEARGHFLKVVCPKLGLKVFQTSRTAQSMASHEKSQGVSREREA